MAHVFIVNEETLPIHLKYQFAGTGAKENKCNFLIDENLSVNHTVERLLVEMIADISRVKKGDKILFYLQKNNKHEGTFFGSFFVAEEPFLCNDEYLKDKLGKNLTFRVKILPDKVYEQGVTERECLDSLKGIEHPYQMCWSLIYRKLKGNRGCTMITDYEYEQILKKIDLKNNGKFLSSKYFDYDEENNKIISYEKEKVYNGKQETLDIQKRLLFKKGKGQAYETHMQVYILQNIFNIPELKIADEKITWIGNEVSCGVGMQSIDICFIQENENNAIINLCEVKDEQPNKYIKDQLGKYVEWTKDYIVPTYNKKVIINPIIIAPTPSQETKEIYKNIKNDLMTKSDKFDVQEIRYIEFKENLMFDSAKI